jgi:glycosyltransferase involved in cell wall biosynthesis
MSIRIAYLVTHPIQYQAPLLRKLSAHPEIDLTALFVSSISTAAFFDKGFGRKIAWEDDLVQGYKHAFVSTGTDAAELSQWAPSGDRLSAFLKPEAFDCLWLHGYSQLGLLRGLFIAMRRRIPVMFRGEGHRLCQRPSKFRAIKERALRVGVRKVSAFLAVGRLNRDYYESLGVEPERIFHVPYAVDNDHFRTAATKYLPDRSRLASDLGLDPARPIILFASKMQPRKRPMDLLRAYASLGKNRTRESLPSLIFLGDGSERARIEAEAARLNLGAVRFVGFKNQDELPRFYAACDLFVLPSEKEPWGLVVNEVMAAGKAVICSSEVGAAYDLIRHGDNGYVYPVGNVDLLADCLNEVLASASRLATMGRKSTEIIEGWSYRQDVDGIIQAADYCVRAKA